MPLTDVRVRNTKPADKPLRLFDGGGLYLEVAPSGGRWWRRKYRYAGKEKRLSLGMYPDVPLKDARKQLAAGVDPGEARKAAKREQSIRPANTFEALGELPTRSGEREFISCLRTLGALLARRHLEHGR